jgi:hypothetical protein
MGLSLESQVVILQHAANLERLLGAYELLPALDFPRLMGRCARTWDCVFENSRRTTGGPEPETPGVFAD